MASPKITMMDDLLMKDEDFNDLLFDFEKNLIAGQPGRKSNSLNDLKPPKSYRNVESKVKSYIASLPAPVTSSGRRKTFKKHTSMPGYVGDSITHGSSESSIINRLEHEYSEYRRQSEHTITELQKQVNVSVVMIAKASNENSDLMDKIIQMQNGLHMQEHHQHHNPTPETIPLNKPLACTPKKAVPKNRNRLVADDTAGSFIGQTVAADETVATLVPVSVAQLECTPKGKRNLSFSSTGDVTRRSGGTDSGINTSDENEIHIQEPIGSDEMDRSQEMPPLVKRKRMKRLLKILVCCGGVSTSSTRKSQKISYKKM